MLPSDEDDRIMSSRERNHIKMMQESLKLEQREYEIFLDAGWNARKEFRINNRMELDVALFDSNEELVGAVETKLISSPQVIERLKGNAARMLYHREIQFFILFFNENAYLYTERGFIKLNDIPTPDNYQSLLDSKTIEMGEILHPSHRPIQIQPAEKEEQGESVSPEMKKLLEMVNSLSMGQKAILEGQEEMRKKLDRISEQIERLSEKITDYQALTERQLKIAETEEEVEKIISVFSDEVVSKIQRAFNANYEESEYRHEEQILSDYFGSSWVKVSEQSKKYLISARLMYKKQSVLGDLVDYSGVCLLVTKALELEMARRFYSDYIVYLENRFGNSASDYENWPYALIKSVRDNTTNTRVKTVIPEHSFTLGAVAFALCYKFASGVSNTRKTTDLSIVIDYANSQLFEEPKSNDDAKNVLFDIAKEVEYIRETYRNPSAHKNALVMESAEECINYVIDVQRVMIKILNYLKY